MHFLLLFLIPQYLICDVGKERYGRIILYDIQDDRIISFQNCEKNNYRNDVVTLNVRDYLSD